MKILIVEDDPMVRSINEAFLIKIDSNYDILQAANIQQAKAHIKKNKINLVLLDVYLGEESGPDLLRWIRKEALDMDVVLITADNSAQTVETVFRLGAIDYLIKPFDFDRFKEAITSVVNRRLIKYDTHVSQEKLDDLIKPNIKKDIQFEKGVNQATYKTVKEVVENAKEPLTAQQIGNKVALARVTVRRYLEHMLEEGLLEQTYNYGKVGRPQKTYQWIKEKR